MAMTEADLLRGVLDLAKVLGWRSAHFRPAMTARGYRTPLQGDGRGFVDCVLVRGSRLVFAELKSDKGRLTDEQDAWLRDLALAGQEVYVWRPDDYPERIAEVLVGA